MQLTELVRLALIEDVGPLDVTTNATVPADRAGVAQVKAKQALVVCGQDAAAEVFRQTGAHYEIVVPDGERVEPGTVIARCSGSLRNILVGERLALNFLMRLCGIATHTANTVSVAPTLKVVDTRKTTPLHRELERRAVRVGGGGNHRFALYDGVLIKDNHIAAAGGISAAVADARAFVHHLLRIEVEVSDLHQLREALEAGADAVLLDNMDDTMLAEAVTIVRAWENAGEGKVLIEASGNMTADRLPGIARIGIDLVSMGGLIHQATWADLSMKVVGVES